jgi:hypothetical protein
VRTALATTVAALVFVPTAAAYVGAFATPSRNITCEADRVGGTTKLGCVVFSASDKRGQKTWSMAPSGSAKVRFVQANIATQVPVLRFGRTWRVAGFACTSRRTGLTCSNRSGHGFFLSRARQRIF